MPAVEQWRYRNKIEYSFGNDDDGELVYGFHAPGHWERIVPIDDCLIASERSNRASRQVLDWCRSKGLTAYDRRTHEGFLRNLVVREGRRTGQIQVRLVTMPGALDTDGLAEAVDCNGLLWTRVRRRRRDDRARRDRADLRQRLPRRGAQRPALPHLPARLLPDEHRDGGAALRARRRVRRAERLRARLRPLLRDRHDRPDARAARVGAVGPGADRAGDRRRDLEREAERDRQRATSSPATCAWR